MYWWLFLFPIAAFIVFIGVMGVLGPRKQNRRDSASAPRPWRRRWVLKLLHGREAVKRVIAGTSAEAQAAMANYDKMPAFLRNIFESSGKAMCVAGSVEGLRITISYEIARRGECRTRSTVVRADYPRPLPFELHIACEGSFTRLGKALFGLRDLELGDEAFDRAVRIKTGDAGAASALAEPRHEGRDPRDNRDLHGGIRDGRLRPSGNGRGATYEASEPSEPVIAALVPVTRALGRA